MALRRLRGTILSLVLLALVASLLQPVFNTKVSALSGTEFQAGRITDDGVFFNAGSLSINDIQIFLNAKVPSCDTNGTQPYGGTTRAAYGTSKGYPPPYVCLKDFRQDTTSKPAETALCNGFSAGNKSAAQIIYEVAQSCNVSPRALIVLLQKEQSLVTDDWPWSSQYRSATGYGCPDTAPCDAEYYGFFNQVYAAARQFKNYAKSPGSFNYLANRNNYIQFNPNAGCGGSTVYIQNQATAGLYNYTPYQPNQAALNNLYGSGDGCSAYGNRNYWRMYNDWFGSTFSPDYSWRVVSQYAYTNDSKTTVKNLASLAPGEKAYIGFTARNAGNMTWSNSGPNPITVGTESPKERTSVFSPGSNWLSPTRPALMKEASVAPGQTGTFEFWVTAPSAIGQGGVRNERFNLVVNGITWMNDTGLSYYTDVAPATYTWQMTSQYSYTDSGKTTQRNLSILFPGDKAYVGFTAKNTGNMTWSNSGPNAVTAGTLSPYERSSVFSPGSSWPSPTRPAIMKEASVAPGQTGTFEFWLTAPSQPGVRNERFGVIANGITWMNDTGLSYYTNVNTPIYTWQMTSQYGYADASKTTIVNLSSLTPGQKTYVGFTAKNTGNMTWSNSGPNALLVGTENPKERASAFSPGSNWLSGTRPTKLKEASVAPGQTGTFEFWLTAPSAGTYNERFNIIANGLTWLNDTGLSYYVKVN